MLFVPIKKEQYGGMGMEWDKVQDMFNYLQSLRYTLADFHQLVFETSMFGTPPLYRCAIIKWSNNPITRDRKREVLIESSDPKQVEAILIMLISIAEEQKRARGG